MPTLSRLALATMVIAGLLLAGCARHQTTRAGGPAARGGATTAPTASHPRPPAEHAATGDKNLPDRTGIAACDDYLSSYLACHRAAGIFAPDQLQSRYEAMRTNLLHDSQNPDIRPQLAERCNSLARSLRQALHGKSCAASPATATSSP